MNCLHAAGLPWKFEDRAFQTKIKRYQHRNLGHWLKGSPERFRIQSSLRGLAHQQSRLGHPIELGSFWVTQHWNVGTVTLKRLLFPRFSHPAEIFPFLKEPPFLLISGVCGPSETAFCPRFCTCPCFHPFRLPHWARERFVILVHIIRRTLSFCPGFQTGLFLGPLSGHLLPHDPVLLLKSLFEAYGPKQASRESVRCQQLH